MGESSSNAISGKLTFWKKYKKS